MWRTYLLLIGFCWPLMLGAQSGRSPASQPGVRALGVGYAPSYIWGHQPVLEQFNSYASGLMIDYSQVVDGNTGWHHNYGHPRIGASLWIQGLGEHIDNYLVGLYPYAELPLLRRRRIDLGFRVGIGLGFNPRPWDPVERPEYRYLGSRLVGTMHPGLYARLPIAGRIDALLACNLGHYSMSNMQMPNLGHNIPQGVVGLQYRLNDAPKDVNQVTRAVVDTSRRRWYVQAFTAVGTRRMSHVKDQDRRFTTFSVGAQWMYRVSGTQALGLGVDWFTGRSIHFQHAKEDTSDISLADQSEVAAKIAHEMRMGSISLQMALGYYVFSRARFMGSSVQRLGIYYYPIEHLFFGVALKTHWDKSDYVEWTLGFTI